MEDLNRPTKKAPAGGRVLCQGVNDALFWGSLCQELDRAGSFLQLQIRTLIVGAIESGRLPLGARMPSSREMAGYLKVSRNTVVLAYEQLVEQRLLASRARSGYFVAGLPLRAEGRPIHEGDERGDRLEGRYAVRPSSYRNIVKPLDWQTYPYPLIFGQFDPELFPANDWRESARAALSVSEINNWARDMIDEDDAGLIDQLRRHVLPSRGVRARPDEVMVTIGAQHALYLVARLFVAPSTRVGLEDPGYPDVRNMVSMLTKDLVPLELDGGGMVPDERFEQCAVAFLTPGHQCPTAAVMPLERRRDVLRKASERDIVLVEDDYAGGLIQTDDAPPPLKSLDRDGRVLYIGSLSKTLAPGLRLGYVVAPAPTIRELRALRRLNIRHAPLNNQRVAAAFIGLGHYRSHMQRISRVLRQRSEILDRLLPDALPGYAVRRGAGGASYWIVGPEDRDTRRLAREAQAEGVLIEPGGVFSKDEATSRHCFRLGFSSIRTERIEAGVARLAAIVARIV